jgi:GTP-binding protein
VLAVNKLDNDQLEPQRHEYHDLGVGEPIAISSTHGLGSDLLVDAILTHLPNAPAATPAEPAPTDEGEERPARVDDGITRVAIVGRPNAGKSSFVNALLGEERLIVHDQPGTTRDAIDIEFRYQEREYLLIDTAGMRKKAGIRSQVEHFSVARSLRAIRAADVCLVLIDAKEGIGEQDLKIIDYATEQGTPMALVWTKWDLIEEKEKRFGEIKEDLDLKAPFLTFVPMITISNTERTRVFKTIELVDKLAAAALRRVPTGQLNNFLGRIKDDHKPPTFRGRVPKILYITQASVKPTVFVMFVNAKKLFHFSYLRYIENRLRETYGFEGVPIKLELREGNPDA